MLQATKRLCARAAVLLICLLVVVAGVSLAGTDEKAFADSPSYTATITSDVEALAPGDQFAVSVNLARDGVSEYPMYALSATIRWNSDMLSLVSYDSGSLDAYTAYKDGHGDIVLNYLSRSLSGTTWESPASILTMTFEAKAAGTSSVAFQRVNVSNETGRGSYACVCTDATVLVGAPEAPAEDAPAVTPSGEGSAGTSEGTASDSDEATANAETSASGKASGSAISGASLLDMTQEERQELLDLGYDVDALVAEAVDKGELTPDQGETVKQQFAEAANPSVAGAFPLVPVVVVAVIVIAAVCAGIVLVRRKRRSSEAGQR